jgi:hypothetical protein
VGGERAPSFVIAFPHVRPQRVVGDVQLVGDLRSGVRQRTNWTTSRSR